MGFSTTQKKTFNERVSENYKFYNNSELVQIILNGLKERIEDAEANQLDTTKLMLAQKEFLRAQKYYMTIANTRNTDYHKFNGTDIPKQFPRIFLKICFELLRDYYSLLRQEKK